MLEGDERDDDGKQLESEHERPRELLRSSLCSRRAERENRGKSGVFGLSRRPPAVRGTTVCKAPDSCPGEAQAATVAKRALARRAETKRRMDLRDAR
jgi:hypothetical protein